MSELRIYSAHSDHLRAKIYEDGSIRNGAGALVGFVNPDGSAGNANEEYVGEINQGGQVLNSSDETVGYIDMGKATLRDAGDSHFATLGSHGDIRDTMETVVGRVEGFTFQHIRKLAAYIFFFDQALIKPGLPTSVSTAQVDAALARGVVDTTPLEGTGQGMESLSKEEERLLKHLKLKGDSSALAPKPAQPAANPKPVETPSHTTAPVSAPAPAPSTWTPTTHAEPAQTDDRGLQTDAARREEERIAKMFSKMGTAPSSGGSAAHSTSSTHATSTAPVPASHGTTHPVPTHAEVGGLFENELLHELNIARTEPARFVTYLKEMLGHFQGTQYHIPGTKAIRETREGVAAVQSALDVMQNQRPLSEVTLSGGLSHSCRDLVAKASQTTNVASVETDSEADARLSKYGRFVGRLFQNVAIGNLTPREVILWWLIDDGNSSRQNREAVLDPAIKVAGVSSGPHMKFGRVTILASAGGYEDGSSAQAPVATPLDAPVVAAETEISIGPFEDKKDRYAIELTNLGCPAKALTLRIEKQGLELVLRRKVTVGGKVSEFAQRLALPFPFSADVISAVYAVGASKLTIELRKSAASAPGAGAIASGEVGRYRVPADKSSPADKVSIQAAQSSDHFAFSCEPSKHDTDVVVSLDGRKLNFACQYSFDATVDGEDVIKTIKANSAFTLPFDVSTSQIELLPNPGRGSIVKVFKVPREQAGAATSKVNIADADIAILSKS